MSEGLSRAAASPIPQAIINPKTGQRQTIMMGRLTLRDLGAVEEYLISLKPNPLQMIAKALGDMPKEYADKLVERAYADARRCQMVTGEEVADFIETLNGIGFVFWLAVSKEQPGMFSVEDCKQILASMADEELESMKDRVKRTMDEDSLGNSNGGTPSSMNSTEMPAVKQGSETSSPGDGGSATSANPVVSLAETPMK